MKIIDSDGSAFERGKRQGKIVRKEFRQMFKEFMSSEMWQDNKPPFVKDAMLMPILGIAGALTVRKAVRNLLPLQAQRIRGLAKGLGISERVVWGLQFMEIMMCEAGNTLKVPGGCTQIHAEPKATAKRQPISGRNYDFPNMLKPYQIIRREVPSEAGRYAVTSVTQLPLAGAHQGVNEHGLVISVNNARLFRGKDLRFRGVPYQLILMEALETCRNTREAVDFITKFPCRANAGFFGIVDAEGTVRVIEFTASRFTVRKSDESGVMAQTNHYIQMPEANLPEGTYFTIKGMEGLEYDLSTKTRHAAAYGKLKEAAGNITVEDMMDILSDHSANAGTGCDYTVCCHGDAGSTLSSMVIDVAERRLWISDGLPCLNDYRVVEFRDIPFKKANYLLIGKEALFIFLGAYNLYKAARGFQKILRR